MFAIVCPSHPGVEAALYAAVSAQQGRTKGGAVRALYSVNRKSPV